MMFLTGSAVYYADHRTEAPNAADIGFLDDMIVHHQQARVMSFAYFRHGTAPQLPLTAAEIIQSQSGDIRAMQGLRGDWPQEGTTDGSVMGWMGMKMPRASMPGYATPQEVKQLDTLEGRPLDELFTRLMIRHHLGGIQMAKGAITRANVFAVQDLARAIVSLQTQEIGELNIWRVSAKMNTVTSL